MHRKLTQDQEMMLLALSDGQALDSFSVARRMTEAIRERLAHLDDLSLARISYDNYDAVRVGKQLARKGLVAEFGVPYGPKRFELTRAGRSASEGVIRV